MHIELKSLTYLFILLSIFIHSALCQDGITGYLNNFKSSNASYMPFQLVANISEKGNVVTFHLRVNASIVKAGLVAAMAAAEALPEDFLSGRKLLAKDPYGNDWKLREDYQGTPYSVSISKASPKATFNTGSVGPTLVRPSYEEHHEYYSTRINLEPECNKDNADPTKRYFCCELLVANAYYMIHKYSMAEVGGPTYCSLPNPSGIQDIFATGFSMQVSVIVKVLGFERTVTATLLHRPNTSVVTYITDDKNVSIQSNLLPSNLSQFLTHPSRHSICSKSQLTDYNAKPFLVPWSAFVDGLHNLALDPHTYASKRTCAWPYSSINEDGSSPGIPIGYYLSPMNTTTNTIMAQYVNNYDQFVRYSADTYYSNAFDGGTKDSVGNNFGCSWTGAYSNDGFSSPSLSLTCNQDNTPHYLLLAIKIPKFYFQPQFPYASLAGTQGVYDLRTRRLRLSVTVWASGEVMAPVTVTSKSCTLDSNTIKSYNATAFATRAAARRDIEAGDAEGIHMVYKGLKVRYQFGTNVTELHNTVIGNCTLNVDVAGIKGLYEYFPKLKNIVIPVLAFRSEPYNYRGKARPRAPFDKLNYLFGKRNGLFANGGGTPPPTPPVAPITFEETAPAVATTSTPVNASISNSSNSNSTSSYNVTYITTFASSVTHIIPQSALDDTLAAALSLDRLANRSLSTDEVLQLARGSNNTEPTADESDLALGENDPSINNRMSLAELYEEFLLTHSDFHNLKDAANTTVDPSIVSAIKTIAATNKGSYPLPRGNISLPPFMKYLYYPNLYNDEEIAIKYFGRKIRIGKYPNIKWPLSPNRFQLDPILWLENQRQRAAVEQNLTYLAGNLSDLLNSSDSQSNESSVNLSEAEVQLIEDEIALIEQLLFNPLHNKDMVIVPPDNHPLLTDDGLWRFGIDPAGTAVIVPYHNDNLTDSTATSSSDRSNTNSLYFKHKDGTTVYYPQEDGSLSSAIGTFAQQLAAIPVYSSIIDKYRKEEPMFWPSVMLAIVAVGALIINFTFYILMYLGRALTRLLVIRATKAAERAEEEREEDEKRLAKEEKKRLKLKKERKEQRRLKKEEVHTEEKEKEAEGKGGHSFVNIAADRHRSSASSQILSGSRRGSTVVESHKNVTRDERSRGSAAQSSLLEMADENDCGNEDLHAKPGSSAASSLRSANQFSVPNGSRRKSSIADPDGYVREKKIKVKRRKDGPG